MRLLRTPRLRKPAAKALTQKPIAAGIRRRKRSMKAKKRASVLRLNERK